jgi:catechol 2,3-dioxygenase-like lactoylglutathione lyase family enzyme
MNLDAIGIVSSDLSQSIKFYEIFGIHFKEIGEGHFEGVTKSGLRLMLDSVELMKKINPNWISPSGSGIVLCFKQSDVSSVDEAFFKISTQGFSIVKEPWDAFWNQRYCSVLDPDGNQIDIFADL